MITGKIDVTKIDKGKLFPGKKGTYLDIVLIDTPDNDYGDFMIVQSVTQEERQAGKRGAILGNAKMIHSGQSRRPDSNTAPKPQPSQQPSDSDDVPF